MYNVTNLRVIDASVFPVSFCAHLVSSTYVIAETGAELFLTDWESPAVAANKGGSTTTNGSTFSKETPTSKNRLILNKLCTLCFDSFNNVYHSVKFVTHAAKLGNRVVYEHAVT